MSATAQANDIVVGALVDELARSGIQDACLCPGSRSAPLAYKLAQHPTIKLWTHLDERSAAYFALGIAKAARRPVALLATSGTAAANFMPAVVEAFYSRVPLVVLTADRPHELRDAGAAQTIDQPRLYGEHVKWFFDLPEPEATPDLVRHARTVAARAVAVALDEPCGPVHLNWPLREPLVPEPAAEPAAWGARARGTPYVTVAAGLRAPTSDMLGRLAAELGGTERGLIACGPQDDADLPAAVASLAQHLAWPIFADPLSGVRYGEHDRSLVLDAYDATLRLADDLPAPEVVLRFGGLPTSKPLLQYMQLHATTRQIVVDGGAGWREPTSLATDMLHVDARLLCAALASALPTRAPGDWTAHWLSRDRVVRQALVEHAAGLDELFEGAVFSELAALLPERATLYVGNSMPVRDLDTFLGMTDHPWRVLSNRGANGIDGVVSSALGASAVANTPTVLVIGDISFYHDLNGLLAARRHALDLLVVLMNNDGGGIFSFLPQAEHPEHFEELFGTPHGLDFRPFVEGYGGHFERVASWAEFSTATRDGLSRGGLHVIEVPTERRRNVELHRAAWRAVSSALAPIAAVT
jgi:2-succinyl-5-enolpyruvyl-6-hydroxy-3-cyclohexene-1-carboxylate synthase